MSQNKTKQTKIELLKDAEMKAVKGGSILHLVLTGTAAVVGLGYAVHDLAGKAGTAYGESVTCLSGGTITRGGSTSKSR